MLEKNGTLLIDSLMFPDRDYIISKIHEILKYSNQNPQMKIHDHLGQEISVEDLADRYYTNPEAYFIREEKK